MKKIAFGVLVVILAAWGCSSTTTVVYEGEIIAAEFHKNSWSGDYYLVTFKDAITPVKVMHRHAGVLVLEKRYRLLNVKLGFGGGDFYRLERVDE